MKLRLGQEGKRKQPRAVDVLAQERPMNLLQQVKLLLPEMQAKIQEGMSESDKLFSLIMQDWWFAKVFDPEFTVPGVEVEAVKEKWLEYVAKHEETKKNITVEKEQKRYSVWITNASAELGIIFPQLIPEIQQRIQPHLNIALNELRDTALNPDKEDVERLIGLYRLRVFDQVAVDTIIDQRADQYIQRLREIFDQTEKTEDEKTEGVVFAFTLRLVYPQRETELIDMSQAAAGIIDEMSAAYPESQFQAKAIQTLLLSPHIEVTPPGQVTFTPPPEFLTPKQPLPERNTL